MQKVFTITADGSHTIYLPEMNEHYHSIYGAIQESLHIYIGQGLLQTAKDEVSILEIGFGTGLNAYLTSCNARERNISVNYFCLEKYPLAETEYLQLNYPESIFPEFSDIFWKLHRAEWEIINEITPIFRLHKVQADLLTYQFNPALQFDIVYYDAFAPGKQPEMWTDEIIQKVAATVKAGGILVTYCAKGSVRRTFSSAGFIMERIPGPIGKKEILRGKKTFDALR